MMLLHMLLNGILSVSQIDKLGLDQAGELGRKESQP